MLNQAHLARWRGNCLATLGVEEAVKNLTAARTACARCRRLAPRRAYRAVALRQRGDVGRVPDARGGSRSYFPAQDQQVEKPTRVPEFKISPRIAQAPWPTAPTRTCLASVARIRSGDSFACGRPLDEYADGAVHARTATPSADKSPTPGSASPPRYVPPTVPMCVVVQRAG